MPINHPIIGSRIAKRRKELSMTQSQVEELAHLGQKYMSNIENGRSRVSIETLMKLCHVLDCTPNEILLGVSEDNLSDFTHAVEMKTKEMSVVKRQFLIRFIDLLNEHSF